jgi:alpha-N-acetylglucosamine transferase
MILWLGNFQVHKAAKWKRGNAAIKKSASLFTILYCRTTAISKSLHREDVSKCRLLNVLVSQVLLWYTSYLTVQASISNSHEGVKTPMKVILHQPSRIRSQGPSQTFVTLFLQEEPVNSLCRRNSSIAHCSDLKSKFWLDLHRPGEFA